ncbi:hypothetical protein TeGR_g643 [Tetraparma gracilis]|uniref:Uncharacterized protein n=2 Tax=Tetraparma gracilis TaxID=2962635 RepID=A0ABQ6M5F3_9STRA|nr:hypothetical protein TeGR_g643 [Tetraparma gracilis]
MEPPRDSTTAPENMEPTVPRAPSSFVHLKDCHDLIWVEGGAEGGAPPELYEPFSGAVSYDKGIYDGCLLSGGRRCRDCTARSSISCDLSSVLYIGDKAFGKCTALSDASGCNLENVTVIGVCAFQSCTSLGAIPAFPKVRAIPSCAFLDCTSLVDLGEFPKVTFIGASAFRRCTALRVLNGDFGRLRTLGASAFSGCGSLETVACSFAKLQVVGERAFANCHKLAGESVHMDELREVGVEGFKNCHALASVSMGAVTKLSLGAFSGCAALASVEMDELQEIGERAFGGCEALRSVRMRSLLRIGERAFIGCAALRTVECNFSPVAHIGDMAFSGCGLLRYIACDIARATICTNTFRGCNALLPADLARHNAQDAGQLRRVVAHLRLKLGRPRRRLALLACIARAHEEKKGGREEQLHPLLKRIAFDMLPEIVREHLVPFLVG